MHITSRNVSGVHAVNQLEQDLVKKAVVNWVCANVAMDSMMNNFGGDVEEYLACEEAIRETENSLEIHFEESGANGEYDSVATVDNIGIGEYYANQYKITWEYEN